MKQAGTLKVGEVPFLVSEIRNTHATNIVTLVFQGGMLDEVINSGR